MNIIVSNSLFHYFIQFFKERKNIAPTLIGNFKD